MKYIKLIIIAIITLFLFNNFSFAELDWNTISGKNKTSSSSTSSYVSYVYIEKNSSKYHLYGCDYLKGTPYKLTKAEAKDKGYSPCKYCVLGEKKESSNNKDNSFIIITIIIVFLIAFATGILFPKKIIKAKIYNIKEKMHRKKLDYYQVKLLESPKFKLKKNKSFSFKKLINNLLNKHRVIHLDTIILAIIVVLLLLFIIYYPVISSSVNTFITTYFDNSSTVYVTNTGKKYHKANCLYLTESKEAIDKEQAIAYGYEPCSKCKP